MPSPRKDETRRHFLSRCMSSPEARKDFPRQDQRFAFCESRWGRRHSHTHDCRAHAKITSRVDPTRTLTLRRKFEAEAYRRLVELRKAIRRAVGEDNIFGLPRAKVNLGGPGSFKFKRDPEKVDGFMEWLQRSEEQTILETSKGPASQFVGSKSWADTYISTAYQRGLQDGATRAGQAGIEISDNFIEGAFFRPVHADRAGLIYTRAFNELKGITDEMNKQISSVLAQGIAEGRNPMTLARQLADRVDKIGITRARVLARTEVIAAHAEAQLNMYREAGIEGVTAEVEFATAGDDQVCPQCEGLQGKVFKIEEADGILPVHPNCRCTWIPSIPDIPDVPAGIDEKFDPVFPLDSRGFEKDPFDVADQITEVLKGTRRELDKIKDRAFLESLKRYTDQGFGPLNSWLRGIEGGELDPKLKFMMDQLDTEFAKTSLSRSVELWRGISDEGVEVFQSLEPGDLYIDKGYVSTSAMQGPTEQFTQEAEEAAMTLKILAPKGAPAFPLGSHSTFVEELEVILPRNTTFQVVEKTEEVITVRIVPNE